MTEDEIRLQGYICDGILTHFYATFTLAKADEVAVLLQTTSDEDDASVIALIEVDTGKSADVITGRVADVTKETFVKEKRDS